MSVKYYQVCCLDGYIYPKAAYLGCYADGTPRNLQGLPLTDQNIYYNDNMTQQMCVSYCVTRVFISSSNIKCTPCLARKIVFIVE